MHFSVFLAAMSSGLPASVAAFSGQPYQITNMGVTVNAQGNTTIKFTVHDPDKLSNETAVCSDTWKTKDKSYPQGSYLSCPNSTFGWNIMSDKFQANTFILGLQHDIHDPSVGSPPYDQVTNFASANITKTSMRCTSTLSQCAQAKGNVIKAPLYASVA
nr:hypothetical protein CFP56_46678 [Quercus suber]